MKITEVVTTDSARKSTWRAIKDILDYTTGGSGYDGDESTTKSAETLISNNTYIFTGPMVRMVLIPRDKILSVKSEDQLSSLWQQYMQNKSTKYVSWSKTLEGINNALTNHVDQEMAVSDVGIVISQSGKGVDVEQIILDHSDAQEYAEEQEVLAPLYNSHLTHFLGYTYKNHTTTFFKSNEYQNFLQFVRDEPK